MTDIQPTARLDLSVEEYVRRVMREVMRIIGAVHGKFDADDIAQTIGMHVVRNCVTIMAKYPDPAVYARRRTKHAAISYDRTQRSQRGEGVRLFDQGDGTKRPGRQFVSGDAPGRDGSPALFDNAKGRTNGFEADIDEWIQASETLQRCCTGIPKAHLEEVMLVDGCGYTVLEVAIMRGQARETVSRRLNATRRRISKNRDAMPNEEEFPA